MLEVNKRSQKHHLGIDCTDSPRGPVQPVLPVVCQAGGVPEGGERDAPQAGTVQLMRRQRQPFQVALTLGRLTLNDTTGAVQNSASDRFIQPGMRLPARR